MARILLLAGGNLGDVKRTLQAVQQAVNSRIGAVLRCSHRYQSEPWGFEAEEKFYNQALEVSTEMSPEELLTEIHCIEREMGRNHAAEALERAAGNRYCSRTIDIDIIFYDDLVVDTPCLKIPHPLVAEREFALVPLAEIARQKCHPVTGLTVEQMLENLHKKE